MNRNANASPKYCVIRDTSYNGLKTHFSVGLLGRCVDKGDEWTWPRHNVRYYSSEGRLDRQAYQRAIKPGDVFDSLEAAKAACAQAATP